MLINKLLVTLAFPLLFSNAVAANYNSVYSDYLTRDYEAAFREMLPFAEKENVDAQYRVAAMYEFGNGVRSGA